MLKSNQQDLALRTTYGAGFARKLVQTDRTTLLVIGGGACSHESYFPQPGTDAGRFRVRSQSNLRIEPVRNFHWNFQVYENYDTRPPVNAPKNDLGPTTSIGWTF